MTCSELRIELDHASTEEIAAHLGRCDDSFTPPLSSRVCLPAYAEKIRRHGVTFEAWAGVDLVGLVAGYFNNRATREGFLTHLSVETAWRGRKVAITLMGNALEWGRAHDYCRIRTETQRANSAAAHVCEKIGFKIVGTRNDFLVLVFKCT